MGMPFKFNWVWLEDPKFNTLVKDFGSQFSAKEAYPMGEIIEKLHVLKLVVKKMGEKKKKLMHKYLKGISDELEK